MARAASTDPYMSFRYHLYDPEGGNLDPVSGFTSMSMPEISVQEATYRTGVQLWTEKYPGVQSVGDVQLAKGTVKRDSDFFNWVLKVINGGQDYRSDLVGAEFHILDEFGIDGTPSRIIRLRECWGKSAKPVSDKDNSASDVSLQTLTISCEQLDVEIVPTG